MITAPNDKAAALGGTEATPSSIDDALTLVRDLRKRVRQKDTAEAPSKAYLAARDRVRKTIERAGSAPPASG